MATSPADPVWPWLPGCCLDAWVQAFGSVHVCLSHWGCVALMDPDPQVSLGGVLPSSPTPSSPPRVDRGTSSFPPNTGPSPPLSAYLSAAWEDPQLSCLWGFTHQAAVIPRTPSHPGDQPSMDRVTKELLRGLSGLPSWCHKLSASVSPMSPVRRWCLHLSLRLHS